MMDIEKQYKESYDGREGCFIVLAAAFVVFVIMMVPFIIAFVKNN
jgi:hypothetical protein